MNEVPTLSGTDDLASALAACLAGYGYANPRVSSLRRLTGGSTHDTWAFDLHYGGEVEPLILRRNLAAGSLELTPAAEFALLRWLHGEGLPVARPLSCDPQGGTLGMPFIIAERIIGTDLRKVLAKGATQRDRAEIGRELAALQAHIHALDVHACPTGVFEPLDPAREVRRWTDPLLVNHGAVGPVLRAAIAWLTANVPAIATPCIVHGDFKANNILWSEAGSPVILDWELAHIGDPAEDLAWTMLWSTRDDIVCGLLAPSDYIAAYEKASGAPVDRQRLFFWQLYALVKLCGILRSGSGTAHNERDLGPSHALLSRGSAHLEAAIADYLVAISGAAAA